MSAQAKVVPHVSISCRNRNIGIMLRQAKTGPVAPHAGNTTRIWKGQGHNSERVRPRTQCRKGKAKNTV
eukprot:1145604-Pelagomonas_calceolata.AAC.8